MNTRVGWTKKSWIKGDGSRLFRMVNTSDSKNAVNIFGPHIVAPGLDRF